MRLLIAAALAALCFIAPGAVAQQPGPPMQVLSSMYAACRANGISAPACGCMAGYMAGLLNDQELYVLEPALGAMVEGRAINDQEMAAVLARLMTLNMPSQEMQALGVSLQANGARMSAEASRVEQICEALD